MNLHSVHRDKTKYVNGITAQLFKLIQKILPKSPESKNRTKAKEIIAHEAIWLASRPKASQVKEINKPCIETNEGTHIYHDSKIICNM